ncbi:MAG: tetratricopeptide repeat protein [Bryobacteraceae bacterium]
MSDLAPQDVYTREEVLRLLSISERQLRGWERHDLIRPLSQFAFSDLIALRTLTKLRQDRVPSAKIRLALSALRKKMRHVTDPLKELKVVSDGKRIRVEISGQHMEPVSGQLLFNFDQTELKRLLSFPDRGKNEQNAERQNAEMWFQKGLDLEHTGAPVEQIAEAYEKAAKLDPTSAGALVNLGTIHFNARSLVKAEACYRAAIAIDPDYALAHFNIANLYDEQGDYAKATQHYSTAVVLNPRYADAHYNLALLYQGNGQVMEAVRHWKTYLKLDPASAWGAIARRELGKLRTTTVLEGRGRDKFDSNLTGPGR